MYSVLSLLLNPVYHDFSLIVFCDPGLCVLGKGDAELARMFLNAKSMMQISGDIGCGTMVPDSRIL